MPPNPASPDISGPCKHKSSTKVSTNGDPQEAWKHQKSGTTTKSVVTALTKNNIPSKTATGTSNLKAVPVAPNRASMKVPGKSIQKCIESEDSEDSDELTSNQTRTL